MQVRKPLFLRKSKIVKSASQRIREADCACLPAPAGKPAGRSVALWELSNRYS